MKKNSAIKEPLGKRIVNRLTSLKVVRVVHVWSQRCTLPGFKRMPVCDVVSCFLGGVKQGKVWQRAKGLSYSLLMALPPLLVFMFTLIAYLPVDGAQDELLNELSEIIPARFFDRISFTINDVMGHKHSKLLSIGFFVSIFLASNGIYGCLRSMNYANDTVRRGSFLTVYLISILLVILLYILVVVVAVLLVGYRFMIGWIVTHQWLPSTHISMFLISAGRWIILLLLTLLILSVIYYFAQGKTLKEFFTGKSDLPSFGFFAPGSILATALFFVLTWGIQIYLNYFNKYGLLYGSIGTVLVIMLWLFLNCYVLLIGYQINTSIVEAAKNPKSKPIPKRSICRKIKKSNSSEKETNNI